MIVSRRSKLILIHVHRTGGTSLATLIRKTLSDSKEVISQHNGIKHYEAYLSEWYSDYFIFGVTRNPWDRILSWYSLLNKTSFKSLNEEKKALEDFIINDQALTNFKTTNFHYNSIDYFSNTDNELKTDAILRFENLQEEVTNLFQSRGIMLDKLPVLNTSSAKDYRDYYTEKAKNAIALKCKKDIECFNYTF